MTDVPGEVPGDAEAERDELYGDPDAENGYEDPDHADDVAALDDEPDEAVLLAEADEPDEVLPIYEGVVRGGPWNGTRVQIRYPKGFLLVDMPTRRVWVYDRTVGGEYQARAEEAEQLRDDGTVNRWRAADEPNYDLCVYDPEAVGQP